MADNSHGPGMNGRRPVKRVDPGFKERIPMRRRADGPAGGDGENPKPGEAAPPVPEEVASAETVMEGMLPPAEEVSDEEIFEKSAPKKPAPPKPAPGAGQAARKPAGASPSQPGKPRPPTTRPSAAVVKPGAVPAQGKKPQPHAGPAAPQSGVKKTSTRSVQAPAASAKPAAKPGNADGAGDAGTAGPKAGTEEISPKDMARRMKKMGVEEPAAPKQKPASGRKPRAAAADDEDVLEPISRAKTPKTGGTRRKSRLGMPDFAFRGSGFRLGLVVCPCYLSALLGAACIALGAAVFLRGRPDLSARIPQFRPEWLDQLFGSIPFDFSTVPLMPYSPAAPAAVFLLLAALLHVKVRSFRLGNTYVFKSQLIDGRTALSRLASRAVRCILSLPTAGLAWPWLYAADVRRDYESCSLKRRDDEVGFDGSGFQVLWLCLVTFVMSPLALLSLGILAPLASIRWIDWEQGHITVRIEGGGTARSEFEGSAKSLVGRQLAWSVLTLLTAALCRPFAMADVWNWIADNTNMRLPEESEPEERDRKEPEEEAGPPEEEE